MSATKRRVLITGANRGLGLELARQCQARGDAVWAGCRAPESAHELQALDGVRVVPLDVTQAESVRAFGEAVAAETGGLDLLVNNAGVNAQAFGADPAKSGVLDLDPAHFTAQMDVNAIGPMLVTRALLPLLETPSSALVVNVSSQLGSLARPVSARHDVGYNASKAALNMITSALASALGARGVAAVAIHPGWVQTDMGGAEAPLTAQASAAAMLATFDRLGPADTGRFLNWDGTPHAW